MINSRTKAEIISIGDELLIGQVVNTNAVWMAEHMNLAGYSVVHMTTISDDEQIIIKAIEEAFGRVEIVLMTGGLGPTKDDITKKTLRKYFDSEMVMHQQTLLHVEEFFKNRNLKMTEVNRQQAMVPEACEVLKNNFGTAPGMWFEKDGKVLVSMPGVPVEMLNLMKDQVIPKLKTCFKADALVHKTVLTHGKGESHLADYISDWEDALPANMGLAYLPRPGMVRLRLSASGVDKRLLMHDINNEIQKLMMLIPELIFGYDEDTMESVVGKRLEKKMVTVSTAESCTGGAIASRITSVAGSSAYFRGSVVAYENTIKRDVLGVCSDDLKKYGAVSEPVVVQMAEGVRKLMKTDFAVATSGIAGPEGGTTEKPVGTVWIALASEQKTIARKFLFGTKRDRNIELSVLSALNMLRKELF